jgi:hypothetical protein
VMRMRSDPPAIGDDAVVAATVRLTDRVLGDLAGSLSFAEAAAVRSTYRVA